MAFQKYKLNKTERMALLGVEEGDAEYQKAQTLEKLSKNGLLDQDTRKGKKHWFVTPAGYVCMALIEEMGVYDDPTKKTPRNRVKSKNPVEKTESSFVEDWTKLID